MACQWVRGNGVEIDALIVTLTVAFCFSERTCLHLARLQLRTKNAEYSSPVLYNGLTTDSTDMTQNGQIDVTCPLENDMWNMLQNIPDLWKEAKPELEKEGVFIQPK